MAGAGAGTIYPACLPTALKRFPDKAGSISSLEQAGASCGPFIMSPIAQWLIDTYGAQKAWAGRCAQRPLQGKWKIRRRHIYTALKLCYTISDRPVGRNERERSYAEI